tara:strand:+ start:363 stop:605 length:243 start_codon:yes stop_codon:yes gene_type:complete
MKKNEIKKKVIEILMDDYQIKKDDLKNNFSFESLNEWDSVKHLDFILKLEEEFRIQFGINQNFDIKTINEFINIISNKIK